MPLIDLGAGEYPSFADVDFADDYLAADIQRAAPWALLDPDSTKPRALVSATRVLQRFLAAPAPDPNDPLVDIPDALKQVTAMLASDLAAKPKLASGASPNSNLKVVRGGTASVEFFRPVDDKAPLPDDLWAMLLAVGLVGALNDPNDSGFPIVTGLNDGCRPLGGRCRDDWRYTQRDYD